MKKGNNIFLVSEYVDNKQNSTGYYWFKIINAISSKNDNIKVISSKESCDLARPGFNKNIEILPIKCKKKQKNNSFLRALFDIIFSIKISLKILLSTKKDDIVMIGTNPTFLFFFLSFLKFFKNFKLIILIHDIFPENLIATSTSKFKLIVLKPIIALFNISYSNASCLVVIGRDMKEIISKKILTTNVIIKYIPNFIDFNDISNPKNKATASNEKLTLNFFGNLGSVQGIETLLEAIFLINNKKICFNFIGNGTSEFLIDDFINKNINIDINLFKNLSFEKNNEMLSNGDIAIVSLSKGMKGLAVPSKTYFSIAANKPILAIADPGSELHMLVKENPGIGWFSEAGDASKLASLINKIYLDGIDKQNNIPISIAKQFYDFSIISKKYINLIDEIKLK